MAISKSTLLFLIASFFFLMMVHSQDTISFNYDSFEENSNFLNYVGDASVPLDSSFARLIRTDSSGSPALDSVGRVVFSPPLQFWVPGRQSTFETTMTFMMTPVNDIPADGICFFIAPVNFPIGFSGGSFGLFDRSGTASSVFAVEFDIYYEGDNRAWDPDFRHIGIDINSRTSRNVSRFDDPLGEVVTARINYNSNTRMITAVANYGSHTSSVSYTFDLKTILPQRVQVGITGATGGQTAIHDLYSWHFTSTMVWDGDSVDDKGKKENLRIKQYV